MQTFHDFARLLEIKRYAPNTINSYHGSLIAFQKYIGNKPLQELSTYKLLHEIGEVVLHKKLAYTTHKQLIGALKLYLMEIHNREIDFSTVYPKTQPRPLPVVLSLQEVKKVLDASTNLKHKCMLTMVYALGLRSGELINLKITDIDKTRRQIHLKNAKGGKDRILPYPDSMRELLKAYYLEFKPQTYLFNGQNAPQYAPESLRQVFIKACVKARIKKTVTLHSLRHAYATHLMDAGTDVRVIKELLGHNNIKTTLIYTHVTQRTLDKVPSPLDFLTALN
ncbi:MAG: site-specific integrase [Nonlabens sp.]|nr:site-specific integrase [Nonlabens sp.]